MKFMNQLVKRRKQKSKRATNEHGFSSFLSAVYFPAESVTLQSMVTVDGTATGNYYNFTTADDPIFKENLSHA